MKQSVKIIDHAFTHVKYCGDPAYECPWFEWDRTLPIKSTEVVIVTEANITNPQIYNVPNIKYAWLLECREYLGHNYDWIVQNYKYYTNVLTHERELLNVIPNALWQPLGGCWIKEKDCSIEHHKTKLISTILSNKNFMSGHQLRHKVFSNIRQIDYYGNYVKYMEYKLEALRDYKYHLCIENSKSPGYFTKKLLDCFATGCVPIYWGDPLIGDVFDTSGMIIVNSFSEIADIISNLKQVDYNSFNDGIKNNFKIFKNFVLPENYMYTNHKPIFNLN
jgi:hypothetical protein